jgi:exodeoxyribonuclease VII large subunit
LALQNDFKVHHSELKGAQNRLFSLNPFSVLQRGYAIVTDAQGRVVNSVQQVHKEDILDVKVVDGVILTRVLSEPQAQINGDGSNVKNK